MPRPSNNTLCSVQDCQKKFFAKGYCKYHYERVRVFGRADRLNARLSISGTDKLKEWLLLHKNETTTGCWEWRRAITHGYGVITIQRRSWRVHRISAMIFHNFDIYSKLQVCHKCDNRKCFNPEHLFIGTNKDNYIDSKNKGRNSCGFRHGQSKLSERDVCSIREKLMNGVKGVILSKQFHVSQSVICSIKNARTWKHCR